MVALMVVASMASLKIVITLVSMLTPEALLTGDTEDTVGAVVSGRVMVTEALRLVDTLLAASLAQA